MYNEATGQTAIRKNCSRLSAVFGKLVQNVVLLFRKREAGRPKRKIAFRKKLNLAPMQDSDSFL